MNPLSLWAPFHFFGRPGLYLGLGLFLAMPIFWLVYEKYLRAHPLSLPLGRPEFAKLILLWALRLPAIPTLLGMFVWLVGGPAGRAFFIMQLLPWMPLLFYISPVIALVRWNTTNEAFRHSLSSTTPSDLPSTSDSSLDP